MRTDILLVVGALPRVQRSRTCTTCGTVKCVLSETPALTRSGSPSKGALAGAIIGVFIFLSGVVALYFWYRRRQRLCATTATEVKDVPASAVDVLNRPDPSEKLTTSPNPDLVNNVRVYSIQSDRTIDLDPESQHASTRDPSRFSQVSNPFSDHQSSIQTTGSTGTEGTNVIPIALVQPASIRSGASSEHSSPESTSLVPSRPARSPELDLYDSSRETSGLAYAASQISGISDVSSRISFTSGISYSSEFLNEAPVIVNNKGAVRQVIGSVKAEMINAPGSSVPNSPNNTLSPTIVASVASRPSIRSPLAATSFGPSDVVSEHEEEQELSVRTSDPFSDQHSLVSPPRTVTTFGTPEATPRPDSELQELVQPWAQLSEGSRPSSVSTQAGSLIANIGSATRVNLGYSDLRTGNSLPNTPSTGGRSPYRTTMGHLVTPPTNESPGTLQQQQQQALAHAHAQAQAQGGERIRRISGSSAISNTADSILESFPFVPPSPISNRPVRSLPHSPLNQREFKPNTKSPTKAEAPRAGSPPKRPREPLREPSTAPQKNRRTLGLSSGSQVSVASSGLGSFPFQIESGPADGSKSPVPPSAFRGRQRASLDTLALTSDLSSYPLSYDRAEPRDSFPPT